MGGYRERRAAGRKRGQGSKRKKKENGLTGENMGRVEELKDGRDEREGERRVEGGKTHCLKGIGR